MKSSDLSRLANPATLFSLSGANPRPATFADAVLLIIDAQDEYATGRLPLHGIEAAVDATERLLVAARAAGTPVIHVVHRAAPGSFLFDPNTPAVAIIERLAPHDGEPVVAKRLPNAFTGTDLAGHLSEIEARSGRRALLLTGFMTHNCVSATARAALDRGLPVTVVANATATRDLPSPLGGTVSAEIVQQAELAALADRTAVVVPSMDALSSAVVAAA